MTTLQTTLRWGRPALACLLLTVSSACDQPLKTDEFKILFGGDTSFGENYHRAIRQSGGTSVLDNHDYERPLSALRPLMVASDVVLLNLETPLTDLQRSPLHGRKKYIHWNDPRRAPGILRSHNVHVVSLANNHTMDFGMAGLQQTLGVLRAADIEPIGAGVDEADAARPLVREVSVGAQRFRFAVIAGFEYRRNYDTAYGFYARNELGGVNRLNVNAIEGQITRLKSEDANTFVVVWPHWGRNYARRRQREITATHRLVEAGADLVIGHGAHTLQGIERYRGRWILYNIGNFMFNSPGRYARYGAPPYSLAASLVVREHEGRVAKFLRCYPLLTDNQQTDYRSRPVTRSEFDHAYQLLMARSVGSPDLVDHWTIARDSFGWYVDLSLGPRE